jgi:hypothetical protein
VLISCALQQWISPARRSETECTTWKVLLESWLSGAYAYLMYCAAKKSSSRSSVATGLMRPLRPRYRRTTSRCVFGSHSYVHHKRMIKGLWTVCVFRYAQTLWYCGWLEDGKWQSLGRYRRAVASASVGINKFVKSQSCLKLMSTIANQDCFPSCDEDSGGECLTRIASERSGGLMSAIDRATPLFDSQLFYSPLLSSLSVAR